MQGFVLLILSIALPHLTLSQTVAGLPPIPEDLTTPVQIRLAYSGPTSMTIGWNTFQQTTTPKVHYGLRPSELVLSTQSDLSVTYPTSRTWANTVKLTELRPATTYYYKIHSTNSTIYSFRTARVAGDLTPYSAAVVVDMGVFGPDGLGIRNISYTGKPITDSLYPGEHTTIEALVADEANYEFVVHPGDFAYADAWLKEEIAGYINGTIEQGQQIYEGLNEQFWDQLSVVSRIKPYMVTAGNHEANCVNGHSYGFNESNCPMGQTNFTGFVNRFGLTMPTSPSDISINSIAPSIAAREDLFHRSNQLPPRTTTDRSSKALPPFWYSFDYGMTHYVMFDTETDFGTGFKGPDETGGGQRDHDGPFGSYLDQQIDFLKKDLASVDRLVTPWVVAAGHRPWYVASTRACHVCQTVFEPIFNQYGVDIAVFGHTHNMERIMPIANNVMDPAGLNNPTAPMYIVNGAAGHYEGLVDLSSPLPEYVAYGNDTHYGYSKLVFHDRNHLEVQMIRSDTGAVIDTATLYKKH